MVRFFDWACIRRLWVPGVRFREREQRLLERFIFMRVWLKRSEQEERLRFEVRFRVRFGSWRMEWFSGVGGKRRREKDRFCGIVKFFGKTTEQDGVWIVNLVSGNSTDTFPW